MTYVKNDLAPKSYSNYEGRSTKENYNNRLNPSSKTKILNRKQSIGVGGGIWIGCPQAVYSKSYFHAQGSLWSLGLSSGTTLDACLHQGDELIELLGALGFRVLGFGV